MVDNVPASGVKQGPGTRCWCCKFLPRIAWPKIGWPMVRVYVEILILGLLIIELRGGSTGRWSLSSRLPLLSALCIRVFDSERLEYVASHDLKANHQVQDSDLVFHPRLDTSLYRFLPSRAGRVGKYLKTDIPQGQPVTLDDLNTDSLAPQPPTNILVEVQVAKGSTLEGLFTAKSKVILMPSGSSNRVEGIIVRGIDQDSAIAPNQPKKNGTKTNK